MNANGPIRQDHPTRVTALAFTGDPELGAITTPHGRLQFLQVVGLTGDEYAAARRWDTNGVLGLLAERRPLLVTDLDRPSVTDDPAVQAAIDAGHARDGSSTGLLMVAGFGYTFERETVRLRFRETTVATVAQAVRDRLPYGRTLFLDGDSVRVALARAEVFAVRQPGDGVLEVDLPEEAVAALPDALRPGTRLVPGTGSMIVEVVTPRSSEAP